MLVYQRVKPIIKHPQLGFGVGYTLISRDVMVGKWA